ncbi:MAG: S41 family peptidase [Gemmatimonadaceae bacterium]
MDFLRRLRGDQAYRTGLVAVVFLIAIVAGGALVHRGARGGPPTAYEAARLYDNVKAHIARDYVDSIGEEQLYRMSVDGLLYELGDPYSRFLSSERALRLSESTSGNYVGVGMQVDIRDGWIIVIAPLPGSPAERAGLQTGDRILEINGKSTFNWTSEEASRALRGPEGSPVSVVVDRVNFEQPLMLRFTRGRVHQNAVRRSAMVAPGVGYIDLKIFTDSTADEVERAVRELMGAGMKTLILDLRVNPGGLLHQGVKVADLFLDQGDPIVRIRGRTPDANRDFVDSAAQSWPQLPLVVLVDRRSASASEIVAGALQDLDRAAIIGQPTYGKGSAQTVFPMAAEHTGAVKLTTARWYTPLGRTIAQPSERASPLLEESEKKRTRFRSMGGRTILGGGGIVPDALAGDTAEAPQAAELLRQLGPNVRRFRDAITDYALGAKRAGNGIAPGFVVTQPMLDDLWNRMRQRGIDVPKVIYDDAAQYVSRVLGYEIARYVLGPEAEFHRRAADDAVIMAALSAINGARDARDLVQRVEAMGADAEKQALRE